MSDALGPARLVEVVLPLAFIPGALALLAETGGWRRLAAAYPLGGRRFPRGHRRFGWALFSGWIGYNGGMLVGADEHGLYLGLWPLLSFRHPDIFIPWSEIAAVRPRRHLWSAYWTIQTRRAPTVDFALHDRTFHAVRARARAAGVPGEY